MKIENINVNETVEKARALLANEKNISFAFKAVIEVLFLVITLLMNRFNLNSKNSSKPPSTDPNRKKKEKNDGKKKPGGQLGRVGTNLEPVNDPDTIIPIKLDKRHLPRGRYTDAGFEARQVVDMRISRVITEYRAQVLTNTEGKRFVAAFPEGITRPIQYGCSVKAHAVYLSQFQLIPYERVADYFINEASIPISVGSLFNFNREAFDLLDAFDGLAKEQLIKASLVHADETSINVNGKRIWLHNASNEKWTYFYPHEKRGRVAMDEIGILPT
jgi:transposase